MFPGVESNRWPYGPFEHKQGEQKHQTQALRTTFFLHPNHIQKMMARYFPEMIVIIPNVGVQQKKTRSLPFSFLQLWLVACWCIAVHGSTGFFWQVLQSLQADHGPHFVVIQPQSLTWCLVSRHKKTYIYVNKKLAQHKRDCLCIDTIDNQNWWRLFRLFQ